MRRGMFLCAQEAFFLVFAAYYTGTQKVSPSFSYVLSIEKEIEAEVEMEIGHGHGRFVHSRTQEGMFLPCDASPVDFLTMQQHFRRDFDQLSP